jgi:predicted transcriptional regulator
MKKLTLSLLITVLATAYAYSQTAGKLEIGKKAPDWMFVDADKKEFTMNSWPGRVLQINYVDPDEENLNEAYNEAVDKAVKVDKRIDSTQFKGMGIVDCKSTWKPNYLIRLIAGNKAKKYKTVILFDYDGGLQKLWGLPSDSYSVVIVDRNRIVRALYKGKVPENEIEKTIQLIIQLTKEK